MRTAAQAQMLSLQHSKISKVLDTIDKAIEKRCDLGEYSLHINIEKPLINTIIKRLKELKYIVVIKEDRKYDYIIGISWEVIER